jgi:excisionase family DNA binding protein
MTDIRGEPDMTRKDVAEVVSHGVIGRRLLNVGEAAQYLGVSVDTLHKWVQLRAIPHVKAGRALRFDLVALNRYIDEHTIGTID